MPVQQTKFAPQGKQRSSIVQGLEAAIRAEQNTLKSQKMREELPYAGPMKEQALNKNILFNQYYGADKQSMIDQRKSTTEGNNIRNRFLPERLQAEIERLHSVSARNRTGGFGGSGRQAGVQLHVEMLKEIAAEHKGWDDDKVRAAKNAYLSGKRTLPDGEDIGPPTATIASYADQITQKGNTAQANNQMRFANTLEGLLDNAEEHTEGAFKFAGLAGKIKGDVDAVAASVGKNDPDYSDYRKFMDIDVPGLLAEVVRTTGANSTDAQKAQALGQLIRTNLNSNPELAQQTWDELRTVYREIGRRVAQSPTEVKASLSNNEPLVKAVGSASNSSDKKVVKWKERKDGTYGPEE